MYFLFKKHLKINIILNITLSATFCYILMNEVAKIISRGCKLNKPIFSLKIIIDHYRSENLTIIDDLVYCYIISCIDN